MIGKKYHTIGKQFRILTDSDCEYPKIYQIPFFKVQTTKTNRGLTKLFCLMIV